MRRWTAVALGAAGIMLSVAAAASGLPRGGVPHANPRQGHPPNRLAPGFGLRLLAQGRERLENPSGVIVQYGFLNDKPPQPVERTKTEPDQATYLVLRRNPGGPDAGFDYGRHFLFQGHELFGGDVAYVTRINLDVKDRAHRITLLTPVGPDGLTHLNALDGSAWDPFTRTLLLSEEFDVNGGVVELSANWPARPHTLAALGQGGYEGIHPDSHGDIVLAEDVGGTKVNVVRGDPSSAVAARQPNSFIYRFVPAHRGDLSAGGKLQALQVRVGGRPITFHADAPSRDVFSRAQLRLHRLGTTWPARWVTVHDTATDGTAPFDANALAKARGATPFRRPENLQFRPGTGFRELFFTETGDTDALASSHRALALRGSWGSIFRVRFAPGARNGTVSIVVRGDARHASFDNLAFAGRRLLLVGEDRGDTLHAELNRLDSVWAYALSGHGARAERLIALGRDRRSEHDAALIDAGVPGFQNEGDNEPSSLEVSNGSTRVRDMIGTVGNLRGDRWFVIQQHGANRMFEITRP